MNQSIQIGIPNEFHGRNCTVRSLEPLIHNQEEAATLGMRLSRTGISTPFDLILCFHFF